MGDGRLHVQKIKQRMQQILKHSKTGLKKDVNLNNLRGHKRIEFLLSYHHGELAQQSRQYMEEDLSPYAGENQM